MLYAESHPLLKSVFRTSVVLLCFCSCLVFLVQGRVLRPTSFAWISENVSHTVAEEVPQRAEVSSTTYASLQQEFKDDPKVEKVMSGWNTLNAEQIFYDYVVLKNGLQILFVTRKTALTNVMRTTIHTGFLGDPPDLQGLAHFHEHLLPYGSRNFRETHGFESFINSNGGKCNAFTRNGEVSYYQTCLGYDVFEWASRVRDMLTNPVFNETMFIPELFAIENEFSQRRVAYHMLLIIAEVAMNPKSPLTKNGVGPNAVWKRLKEKGIKHMRAQLAVYNALHYTGRNMEVTFHLRPDSLKYRRQIIELFSTVPDKAPQTLEEVQKRLAWLNLDPTETASAFNEHQQEIEHLRHVRGISTMKLGQLGQIVLMGNDPVDSYSLMFQFLLELPSTRKVDVAEFLRVLYYADTPQFPGMLERLNVVSQNSFGDFPNLVLTFGLSAHFKLCPFENDWIYPIMEAIFEYLGFLFSFPESQLKELYDKTIVARFGREPTLYKLLHKTHFHYSDPHKVVDEVVKPRTWDYDFLMDTVKRFLVPENMLVLASSPRYYKDAAAHPEAWKTVKWWNSKYWMTPILPTQLGRCRAAWKKGQQWENEQQKNGRPPKFRFPKYVPVASSNNVKPPSPSGVNSEPPGVYVSGITPTLIDQIQEDARGYHLTIPAKSIQAIPEYFYISSLVPGTTNAIRKVEVVHEHTPGLESAIGYIALKFESPVIGATAEWEAFGKILALTITFLRGETKRGAECQVSVNVEKDTPRWLGVMVKGDSALVEQEFLEVLSCLHTLFYLEDVKGVRGKFNRAFQSLFDLLTFGHDTVIGLAIQHYVEVAAQYETPASILLQSLDASSATYVSRTLAMMRIMLVSTNPVLVAVGDFTRNTVASLARKIVELIPFTNINPRFVPQPRASQLPAAPQRLTTFSVNTIPGFNFNVFFNAYQIPITGNDDNERFLQEIAISVFSGLLDERSKVFYRKKLGMCYSVNVSPVMVLHTESAIGLGLIATSVTHTAREMEAQVDNWKEEIRSYIASLSTEHICRTLRSASRAAIEVAGVEGYINIRFNQILLNQFDVLKFSKMGVACAKIVNDPAAFRTVLLDLVEKFISDSTESTREIRTLIAKGSDGDDLQQIVDEGYSKGFWSKLLEGDPRFNASSVGTQCFGSSHCRRFIGLYKLFPGAVSPTRRLTQQRYEATLRRPPTQLSAHKSATFLTSTRVHG